MNRILNVCAITALGLMFSLGGVGAQTKDKPINDEKSEEWWRQRFDEMPGQYWGENETAAQRMKKMYEAEGKNYENIWGEDPDPKEPPASGASSLRRAGPKNKGRPR
jgi:hypothetical protein